MFRRIGHRPIPTKRVIKGDYQKGMEYIGQAMKQLMQLENAMRFQKLKQLSSTFKDENVVIECWHGFGMSQVVITTRGGGERKRKVKYECPCCVNCLMVGKITKVHDEPVFQDGYPENVYFYGRVFRLDVEVCQELSEGEETDKYVELLNVPYSDMYPDHQVGDRIAVMVNPLISEALAYDYTDPKRYTKIFNEPYYSNTNFDQTVNACLINDPYLRNTEGPDDPYDPTITGIYATDLVATKETCEMTLYDQDFAPDWVPYIALSFKCPKCFKLPSMEDV